MHDKLIPKEKIKAIPEQLSGFIVEQVLDPKGEFYYDGLSNIDNSSKYDNIHVYMTRVRQPRGAGSTFCPGLAFPIRKSGQQRFPNRDKLVFL